MAVDDESKKALNRIKKSTGGGKRATTKLGDLDALQQLKLKMEKSENK